MTETQGDYLGCAIVLLGLWPLLRAVVLAERQRWRAARGMMLASIVMSVVGVLVVILT